jgi:hypothetical protein
MRLRVAYGWIAGLALTALSAAAQDALEVKDRQQLADGLFRRSLFELAAREYAVLADATNAPAMDDVLFRLGECYRR